MSQYAFVDEARTEEIWAENATTKNKGISYYCPNPNCGTKMFIRNVDGERKAHFRSSGRPGHIQYCPYGSDNGYNPNNTTEEGFDADDIIGRMMTTEQRRQNPRVEREGQGMGEAADNVPHTIRQVYDMCKAHSCRDMFNGQTIGQILVDSRSIYMFPRGI